MMVKQMTNEKVWTITKLEELVKDKGCWSCQDDFDVLQDLRMYEHPNGWRFSVKTEKQWIFLVCSECGYQTSLSKLLKSDRCLKKG